MRTDIHDTNADIDHIIFAAYKHAHEHIRVIHVHVAYIQHSTYRQREGEQEQEQEKESERAREKLTSIIEYTQCEEEIRSFRK